MSILISVSGTQSVGKTTLLNGLKNSYAVDDFKVSRAVQEKLGYAKLVDATRTPSKMMAFQEEVFDTKLAHDMSLMDAIPDKILVERSFFDILIYTEIWAEQFPKDRNVRDWLVDYKKRCLDAQGIYNGMIIIHSHPDIPFESGDPNRASIDSRNLFENKLIEYDVIYSKAIKRPGNRNFYAKCDIFSSDIVDRLETSIDFLDSLHIE